MPVIYSRNCPQELYDKVKALAATNRRSFGQEIIVLLDQAVSGGDPVKRRLEALEHMAELRRRNPQPPGAVDTLTLLREEPCPMSRIANCVVDASVAIKLVVPEIDSDKAAAVLSDPNMITHVPDLFFIECANILWKKARRGEYAARDAISGLGRLREMEPGVTSTAYLMDRAFLIAGEFDISAYDACYVALAESLGVPLVTADECLAAKLDGTAHQIVILSMV